MKRHRAQHHPLPGPRLVDIQLESGFHGHTIQVNEANRAAFDKLRDALFCSVRIIGHSISRATESLGRQRR